MALREPKTDPRFYLERGRASVRNRRIHDWRLTLLPAAIDAGVGLPALRICKALCDHQRNYHPVVYVGTRELAQELGMNRAQLQRYVRQLERAGLLRTLIGGGRQAVPRGREGKANTYILGPRLGHDIDAVINGDRGVAVSPQTTATVESPYPAVAKINNGDLQVAPPLRGTSYPSGGSGERTAALTGGPTPSDPTSRPITTHRIRDLLRVFNPVKYGGNHASSGL